MPWKVFKTEDKFCVHKLNEDGSQGEQVACHETEVEAENQVKALYASENASKALVKAIGETQDTVRIGGYGVVWGGRDLEGDHFEKDTNLWLDAPAMPRPMMYDHGRNQVIGKAMIGKWDTAKADDYGLWIEGEIAKSSRYYELIRPLIQAGVVGLSSGAAPHTVIKENGKVKSWGIFEWTLSPTPCEPRTLGVAELRSIADEMPSVKALLPKDVGETSAGATEGNEPAVHSNHQGENEMTEPITIEQIKALMAEERKETVNEMVKSLAAAKPEVKATAISVTTDEGDQPFKSLGEQLKAVYTKAVKGIIDPRLGKSHADATKAVLGLNEGVDSEGAFAIQDDFAALLTDPMFAPGTLLNQMPAPMPLSGSGMKVPYIRDSAAASGTRFGGMVVYKVAEGATISASSPAPLKRLNLDLTKYACVYYATEELLEDAGALASQLQTFVPQAIRYEVENDVINGITNPLGIMAAPALVSVTKETGQAADTIVMENISKMWARMYAPCRSRAIWLINQDVEPQLDLLSIPIGTGGWPVFLPAGGISASPYATLKGRPVLPVDYCQTLGDKGDIILADLSQIVSASKAGGVKATSSIHVAFLTDQQCFKFIYRYTAAPGWESAFTPLNSSATLSPFVTLDARA